MVSTSATPPPPAPGLVSLVSRHTRRQLKFVLPGGALTLWLAPHRELWAVAGMSGWARTAALASLAAGALTVALFLYILTMPLIKGVQPNYAQWRATGELSSVIPLLTASIVVGWSALTLTLGHWSRLGYVEGTIGAVGLYMLAFGMLGLLPAPKMRRQ